jgi:hypothetical protein
MSLTTLEKTRAIAEVTKLPVISQDSGRYVQVLPMRTRGPGGGDRTEIERHEYLTPAGLIGYEEIILEYKGSEIWKYVHAHVGPETHRNARVGVWAQVGE